VYADDPDPITPVELLSWIENLPEESATMRYLGTGWTTIEEILARHNNDYRSANWDPDQGQPGDEHFLRPPHPPEPENESGSDSASPDELRDLIHGRKRMADLHLVS
jgi:hypothetical protein